MRLRTVLLWILACAAAQHAAFAQPRPPQTCSQISCQPIVPLSCGQPYVDQIRPFTATAPQTYQNLYLLNGVQAGDSVLVRVYYPVSPSDPSTNLNLGLSLWDSVNQPPKQPRTQPDPGIYIGATKVQEWDLPAGVGGPFQLVVNSTTNTPGPYSVVFTKLNAPCGSTALASGQTFNGTLSAPLQLNTFQYPVNANDTVSIRWSAVNPYVQGFTPSIFVFDPSGRILLNAANQPAIGGAPGGQLGELTLQAPSSGNLTFMVFDAADTTSTDSSCSTGSASSCSSYTLTAVTLSGTSSGQTLSCGSVVHGTLANALAVDSYSISANAGDTFQIRVANTNGSGLTPVVQIYDSLGTLVAASSNGGSTLGFTAGSAGTYNLVVSAGPSTATGNYALAVNRLNHPCNAQPLTCATPVVDAAIGGLLQTNVYSLSANASDSFLLRVLPSGQNSGLQLRVDVYDPTGALVTTAGSAQGANFIANSAGSYTLIASGNYSASQSNGYSLSLVPLNHACNPGKLSCGSPVTGSLSRPLAYSAYNYTAAPGDSFTVRMLDTTGSLQPSVAVYDPSGNSTGTRITGSVGVDVTNPSGGSYTIIASDANPHPAGGPFAIDVLRTKNACSVPAAQGQTVGGAVSSAQPYLSYTLPASAGDALLVRSSSFTSGFAAEMDLYDPTGAHLQSNTYGISATAAATGNYTVVVGANAPRTAGAYAFSWQLLNKPAGATALACGGSATSSLSLSSQYRYYTLAANTGDLMRLIFTPISDNFSPQIELYDPSGTRLASNSNISQKAAATGNYLAIVGPSNSAGQTGAFTAAYQRPNNPCSPTRLVCGQTTLRQVNIPGQVDIFTFTGTPGDTAALRFTPRSGGYSPFAELYDPTGRLLATGAGGAVRANIVSPAPYSVLVRDAAGVNTGTYRASLQDDTTACPNSDTEPPVITLLHPTGGEVIVGGTTFTIQWQSDDNVGIQSHSVALSTDGGQTFPTVIAPSLSGSAQSFNWVVPPDIAPSRAAAIQVTATDATGNSQSAASGLLSIIGSGFTPNSTAAYTYDSMNRLTQAVLSDGRTITYTYDAAGNLLSVTVSQQ